MKRPCLRLAALAAWACLLVTLDAAADATPTHRIWFQSTPGDFIGQGQTRTLPDAGSTLIAAANYSGGITISTSTYSWGLNFAAANDGPLAPGAYDAAARQPFRGTSHGLDFHGGGSGCNTVAGRFVVLDSAFGPDGAVQRFAANFEQRCEGVGPPLYGEVRFNSSIPLTHEEPAGSSVSDAFAFRPQTLVLPVASSVSGYTTIYGITAPAQISVSGGEYSINDGPFTALPGTAVNRDRVRVRVPGPAAPGTTSVVTLEAGGQVASFAATTIAPGTSQSALWYASTPGDFIGEGRTEFLPAPDWVQQVGEATSTRIELSARGPGGKRYALRLTAPAGTTFQPGAYENAQRRGGTRPSIDVEMNGRACNETAGRFVVLEAVPGAGGALDRFAVNFEQRCGVTGPPLFGEIRFNSAVPFSTAAPPGDTTPDAFGFIAAVNLAPNTTVVSNETRIYGTNAVAPIAITDGEYSVNDAPFTAAPGNVSPRDRIRVRAASPAAAGATASAVLDVGGVSATFTARTYSPAQPLTAFWFQSFPGDYIGLGRTEQYHSPVDGFAIWAAYGNAIEAKVNENSSSSWSLFLRAAHGAPLSVGAHESAVTRGDAGSSPGLDFGGEGRGCSTITGRFVVLEIERDVSGVVTRLAVNFQQKCDAGPFTYGELRYNSFVPLSHLQGTPPDTTPDALAFAPALVRGGTAVNSAAATIYGINASAAIAIAGGEYSVNSGPWTSANGVVVNRDRVQVRTTSSASAGATINVALTVGGSTAIFAVTTWAPAMRLTGLYFRSSPGDHIGQGQTRMFLAPANRIELFSEWTNQRTFQLDGIGGLAFSLRLAAPYSGVLQPGTYENAGGFGFSTPTPGMSFSGDGRACDGRGRFVVHEIAFTAGIVTRAAIDFEQRCYGTEPPLYGELRIDSSVPFSDLVSPMPPGTLAKPFDFDGNGTADLLWMDGSGQAAMWLLNGTSVISGALVLGPSTGWSVSHANGDFDGDGRADLVWRHTDGRVAAWLMNGASATTSGLLLGPATGWSVSHLADLDGDGRSDIVWRHTDGSVAAWMMNGLATTTSAVILGGGGGWTVGHAGDFNADGNADLLFANTDGRVALWLMAGLAPIGSGTILGPGTALRVTHVVDLDGDLDSDLVVRNDATGEVAVWLMNGAAVQSSLAIYGGDSGWRVIEAADLDGDGRADLLWKHDDGTIAAWLMNGGAVASSNILFGPGAWTVKALRDFDGDARADILWHNTSSGEVALWVMNGLSIASSAVVFGGGGGWVPAP